MILSDFLSRQETDKSDPHEIIPISFDTKAILNDRYYNVEEEEEEEGKYLVQTQSETKDSGIKGTRSAWSKERCRSQFKTRMVTKKISETSRKI